LPYPGGPNVARLAEQGDPTRVPFPRALLGSDSLDFSFSGLKTAVRTFVARDGAQTPTADVAAGLQAAIVGVLVEKMRRAARQTGIRTLCIAGGVAANRSLQERMQTLALAEGLRVVSPGYYRLQHHPADGLEFDTYATESLAR
jgi:N6-L-threonylcarbamoyladenine synthase